MPSRFRHSVFTLLSRALSAFDSLKKFDFNWRVWQKLHGT
jgi:hypothetical protein